MKAGGLYLALHPIVRPAFRVGRGWRSACAAMTRHVGCKSASNIDPYRRLTWTHLSRRFSIGDEWVYSSSRWVRIAGRWWVSNHADSQVTKACLTALEETEP